MRGEIPKIHAAGAELVVLGCGSPTQARYFAEDTHLTTPIFTDPTTQAYWAAGMKRGIGRTLSVKGIGHAIRAFKAGHRQRGTQGPPFQLGGILVLAKGGESRYAYISNEAGDHAPIAEVLDALAHV